MIPKKLILEVGARSETGYVRSENQDRMSWSSTSWGQLYIVADGMGGHASGAKAAELTTIGLEQFLREAPLDAGIETAVRTAFEKTNKDVYDRAHTGDPVTDGMGSTGVILLISGRTATIAHVGDSRAYLFRKGKLELLTKDHTQVQRMVDACILTPEQAKNHPSSSILDRAIGNRPTVEVSVLTDLKLANGDGILLCSDGLSGYCDDEEIFSAIDQALTPQENVDRLISLALQKGGEDNVTVQMIKIGIVGEGVGKTLWTGITTLAIFFSTAMLIGGGFIAYRMLTQSSEDNDLFVCSLLQKHAPSSLQLFENLGVTCDKVKPNQPVSSPSPEATQIDKHKQYQGQPNPSKATKENAYPTDSNTERQPKLKPELSRGK